MTAYAIQLVDMTGRPAGELQALAEALELGVMQLARFWPDVAASNVTVVAAESIDHARPVLAIAPNATVADTLGYHTLTDAGMPAGTIELDACLSCGQPYSIAASHELFEMLVNPNVDQFSTYGTSTIMRECCDPVTSSYWFCNSLKLASFVTPAWFDGSAGQMDLLGQVKYPAPTIPAGGWLDIERNGRWVGQWAPDMDPKLVTYHMNRTRHSGRRFAIRQKA